MNKAQCLTQLTGAADLLTMLERLVDHLSSGQGGRDEVPWEGIKLTLEQSRKQVRQVAEVIAHSIYADEPAVPPAAGAETGARRTTLAGRIRRLPNGSKNGTSAGS